MQDIGATKPDHRVFKAALKVLKEDYGVEQRDILHVAQVQTHASLRTPACQSALVCGGHTSWTQTCCLGPPWNAQGLISWLCIVQSLYHDIKPAKALGFKTAWIERRHDQLVATLPCRSS